MANIYILGDVLADNFGMGLQHVEVVIAVFGGHFKGDMQQLTNAGIEFYVVGNVADGIGKLLARPIIDFLCRRQLLAVNVDN